MCSTDTEPRNKLQAHQDPKVQVFPPQQSTLSRACLLQLLLSLVRSVDTCMLEPPAVTFHSPSHCLWCLKILGIMVWPFTALQTPGRTCSVQGVSIPAQEEYLTLCTCAFQPLCACFCAQRVESHPFGEGCSAAPWITKEQTETVWTHQCSVQFSQRVSEAITTPTKVHTATAFLSRLHQED